jgi:hypothetical protein
MKTHVKGKVAGNRKAKQRKRKRNKARVKKTAIIKVRAGY